MCISPVISTCNRGVVFVGSLSGLKVFDRPTSSNTNHHEKIPVENVACYGWSDSPTSMTVGQSKKVTFVAVVFKTSKCGIGNL